MIIDIFTGKILKTIDAGIDSTITSISISGCKKYLLVCSCGKIVKIVDIYLGKVLQTFVGHTDSVNCGTFLKGDKEIVTSSRDCTLKRWNVSSGECIKTFIGHFKPVSSMQVLYDKNKGDKLFSSSWHSDIICWDIASGDIISKMIHNTEITSLCLISTFSPKLASATWRGEIKIWDINTFTCIKTFYPYSSILSIVATPDGMHILSKTSNLQMWNIYNDNYKQKKCDVTIDKFRFFGNTVISNCGSRIISGNNCNVNICSISPTLPIIIKESNNHTLLSDGKIYIYNPNNDSCLLFATITKDTTITSEFNIILKNSQLDDIDLELSHDNVNSWLESLNAVKLQLSLEESEKNIRGKFAILYQYRFELFQLQNDKIFFSRNLIEIISKYLF